MKGRNVRNWHIEKVIGYGVVIVVLALFALLRSATPNMDMIKFGDSLRNGTQSSTGELPSDVANTEAAIKLLGENDNSKEAYPAPVIELLEMLASDGFRYAGATDTFSVLQRDPNGADAPTLKLTLRWETDTIDSISMITDDGVVICDTSSNTPNLKTLTLENYSALLEAARAAYYGQATTYSCIAGNNADHTRPN